jgi:hypothetical protein
MKKDILSILAGVGFILAGQLLGSTGYCKQKIIMHSHNTQSMSHMGRERKRDLFYILRTYYTEDFLVQANWFAMQTTARLHVMFRVGAKQKTF